MWHEAQSLLQGGSCPWPALHRAHGHLSRLQATQKSYSEPVPFGQTRRKFLGDGLGEVIGLPFAPQVCCSSVRIATAHLILASHPSASGLRANRCGPHCAPLVERLGGAGSFGRRRSLVAGSCGRCIPTAPAARLTWCFAASRLAQIRHLSRQKRETLGFAQTPGHPGHAG